MTSQEILTTILSGASLFVAIAVAIASSRRSALKDRIEILEKRVEDAEGKAERAEERAKWADQRRADAEEASLKMLRRYVMTVDPSLDSGDHGAGHDPHLNPHLPRRRSPSSGSLPPAGPTP